MIDIPDHMLGASPSNARVLQPKPLFTCRDKEILRAIRKRFLAYLNLKKIIAALQKKKSRSA